MSNPRTTAASAVVRWEQMGTDLARVIVRARGSDHVADIVVGDDGQPKRVIRSKDGAMRTQSAHFFFCPDFAALGGFDYLSAWKEVGGNLIGTEAYFPFYKADVMTIRFVNGGAHP